MLRHIRTWARLTLMLSLVLLSLSVASAQDAKPEPVGLRPDAPTYALHGPYWVGTRELTIEDPERALPVTVWYPALNPEDVLEAHIYTVDYERNGIFTGLGSALTNAKPDTNGRPFPLVVYSPSVWTSRVQFLQLTEHVASWGFVVLAVDHVGSTLAEWPGNFDYTMVVRNPLDNQKLIAYADALTATGGELEDLIDTDRIAVLGYGTGGTDALFAAGATLDLSAFQNWCSNNPSGGVRDLPSFCAISNNSIYKERLAKLAGLDSLPTGSWPAIGDSRIRAVVAHSPMQPMMFGQTGLQAAIVPSLIIYGTRETLLMPEYNALFAYQNLGSIQKALVALESADSWIGFNACHAYPDITANNFWACSDSIWDMDRAHDLINHFTTAFLLDVLKGDKDAHKALLLDAVSFPGITYETTMK